MWSDSRGVFALVHDECIPYGSDLPSCTPAGEAAQGSSLQFNDGTGWRTLLDLNTFALFGVSGFPGGPVLVVGDPRCGLTMVDVTERSTTCSLPSPTDGNTPLVSVASTNLAYAIANGQLLEYRSGTWQVVVDALPERINGIWASPDIVYLAGEYQPYAWQNQVSGVLQALPNAPAANYIAVWAFKANDVWFGNTYGQLVHYDGTAFGRVEATPYGRGGVVGLWGADNQLFFHGWWDFGRVTGNQIDLLLSLPTPFDGPDGPRIFGLWGNTSKEVFLTLDDSASRDSSTCSARYVLWFDGASLHRF